jgi:hypothetical protein
MKTKNLILGLVAFVFAAGSAFATMDAVNDSAYVWVKYFGETNFTCVDSGLDCTNTASNTQACKISVVIDSPSGTETVDAHLSNTCGATLLKHTNATPRSYDPSEIIIDAQ